GHAILQLDAFQKLAFLFGRNCPHEAHRVLALDLVAWVHETIGKLARRRKHEQALAVEIQPAYGDPFRAADSGKLVEDRGTAFRIGSAHDFARRLVVEQDAHARRDKTQAHQLAVDTDLVVRADFLPDLGRLAVDRDATGDDQLLEPSQRSITTLRKHLVQALRLGEAGP